MCSGWGTQTQATKTTATGKITRQTEPIESDLRLANMTEAARWRRKIFERSC